MLLIFGVTLDKTKKVIHALPELYGVGRASALNICKYLGFSLNLKLNQLTAEQQFQLTKMIKTNFRLEDGLREFVKSNVTRYLNNGSLRGFRHRNRLPVRGQRTHSNGKTPRRVLLGMHKKI